MILKDKMKGFIALVIALAVLVPAQALAVPSMRRGRHELRPAPLPPHFMSEEEYERQMVSAGKHIFAGFVLTGVGGLTAIAGTTYAIANDDDRKTGAIISVCGLSATLAGVIVTLIGYKKRNHAQSRYMPIAPLIDPAKNRYGLMYSARF